LQLLLDTETAEIFRLGEDIIVLKFKSDVLVELRHAQEIDKAFMTVINDRHHYFVIDALDVQSSMTAEAQKYFSRESDVSRYTSAAAIMINSLATRLIATVFMKIYKPVYPSKMFSRKEEALEWFDSFRN
jgi:esterase/lipase superfamily enzyme